MFVHSGVVEEGTLGHDLALMLDVGSRPADGCPPQPLGDPPPARGAAPGAGRSRRAEGIAGRAPTGCVSTSPTLPISGAELEQIEDIANDMVLQNSKVITHLMSVDDAIASGARALFGEKYGDVGGRHGRDRRQRHGLVGRRCGGACGAPAISAPFRNGRKRSRRGCGGSRR
ncbi:MAG: hypothetical protein U1E81_20010 [Xanthobacteraceae bacterium]